MSDTPLRRLLHRSASLLPDALRCRLRDALGLANPEATMRRMKACGFAPGTIVDVGAYVGAWTTLCKRVFPAAKVLMIEPQPGCAGSLDRVCRSLPGVERLQALLGATEHPAVPFHENRSASSVLDEAERDAPPSLVLPATTLDVATDGTAFARPDFIKLDVQGYELEVLKGGDRALGAAEAALLEVNLIEVYRGAPLFDEVVSFMGGRGLRLYDICGLMRRPYDGSLWQMDAVFVRATSPLVASRRWA